MPRFEKGNIMNPNGRPRIPDDIKTLRKLTRFEFERILNDYIHMGMRELKAVAIDQDTPSLDLMIISIIVSAAKLGDPMRLNFILERLIGPSVKKFQIDVNPIVDEVSTMPAKKLKTEIDNLIEARKIVDAEFQEVKKNE